MHPLEGRLRSVLARQHLRQAPWLRSPCPPLLVKLCRAQCPGARGIGPLHRSQPVAAPEAQALHSKTLHGLFEAAAKDANLQNSHHASGL